MALKNKHAGQYALSIVNAPPPPEAEAPMIRRRVGTPGNETDIWVARLAETLGVPTPEQDAKPVYRYVGPASEMCGTAHEPAYDPEYHVYCCSVCGVELERKLVDD